MIAKVRHQVSSPDFRFYIYSVIEKLKERASSQWLVQSVSMSVLTQPLSGLGGISRFASPSLGLGGGFHSGIFFTIASTAWPAAIRVSQFGLLRYVRTCAQPSDSGERRGEEGGAALIQRQVMQLQILKAIQVETIQQGWGTHVSKAVYNIL